MSALFPRDGHALTRTAGELVGRQFIRNPLGELAPLANPTRCGDAEIALNRGLPVVDTRMSAAIVAPLEMKAGV